MMTITPKAWYSWDFTVVEDGRPLASIAPSTWREKGVLTIEGVEHRVHREGIASGDWA